MIHVKQISSNQLFATDDPFLQFLNIRKGKLFYLRPYLGNSGDELIFLGAQQMLANLGIKTTVDSRIAEVILWPGGNPTMWESNLLGWRETWQQHPNAEFVVAPGTFQMGIFDWPSMLKNEGKNLAGLFARDIPSFQNLKQVGLDASVTIGLSHDLALCLRDTEWMADHRAAATDEYVLVALRSDHESSVLKTKLMNGILRHMPGWLARRIMGRLTMKVHAKRLENIKKTLPPGTKVLDWDVSQANFHSYVEGVRRASVVHTDRLHVMLLAVMLNKPVVAYQTSYGKLEAVFENSLKGWAQVSFR